MTNCVKITHQQHSARLEHAIHSKAKGHRDASVFARIGFYILPDSAYLDMVLLGLVFRDTGGTFC